MGDIVLIQRSILKSKKDLISFFFFFNNHAAKNHYFPLIPIGLRNQRAQRDASFRLMNVFPWNR